MTDQQSQARGLARFSLFQRILGLIAGGLIVASGAQLIYTESLLEEAILSQVKREAGVFLLGIEREIQSHGGLSDPERLRNLLIEAGEHDNEALSFVASAIYLYDNSGKVVAHTEVGEHPDKDMMGLHGEVVRTGQPYLGAQIEYQEGGSEPGAPKTDVIIPLHFEGGVIGGLEVELDLRRTLVQIKSLDDRYERDFTLLVGGSALLILLFLWVVIQRGLVRPIRRLGETTRSIAEGDLSARVARTGGDEIGDLGRSVNRMADAIEHLFDEQEQAYLGMMQSLAKALEAKDAYTASHSGRVARFSVMLGQQLGLSADQLKILEQGALMHDLGKIGIADAILNKAAKLTDEEYAVMKSHPEYTAAIMRPLKRFKEFTEIARWHHERWDGKGYPDGLAGEAIPLLARIVSVADTWDAMTGDRVYRKGMPAEKAIAILKQERHLGQWAPHLIDLFVQMIDR